MPIYPYKCPNGHEEELVLSFKDVENPQYCAHCGNSMSQDFSKKSLVFSDSFIGSSKVQVPMWKNGKKYYLTSQNQIREMEKRENLVFGSDAELTAEANKNRQDIENSWVNHVTNQTMEQIDKSKVLHGTQ